MRLFSADRRGLYGNGPLVLTKRTYGIFREIEPTQLYSKEAIEHHIQELFPEGLSIHGWLHIAHTARFGDGMHSDAAMEIVFEYVRRAVFPHMPSRMQCFFAFDDLDRVLSFASLTHNVIRVVELRSERIVRLDMNWLKMAPQVAGLSFFAHQYWSGTPTASPDWEYLLFPPVDVIELDQP
ncbi:DUF2441 domain-containing protein [Rhizobium sp. AU243]|uniref:DUF2441 domain-containing protein n=1 Tax=Rhizobium sp. AU243 TaxID=2303425 RepID=UPI0010CB1A1B|nr:DUF2441 domain-containing protein [Rhizobium sp. AU243]TKV76728.1 DUF2441 domain-containing protein [Rhizobium sp. AU243]